jgi:hypothetical protein
MRARVLAAACVGAACVGSSVGLSCKDTSRVYLGEAALSGDAADVGVQWSVNASAGSVTLALSGNTSSGWLGLGLGEITSGSMIGADIVTARFEGGKPVVEDRFVPWQAFPFAPYGARYFAPSLPAEGLSTSPSLFPSLDTSLGGTGSWEVLSGAQAGGCSSVVMRRALVTGDRNDRPFTPGAAQVVMWAYGDSDAVGYHGGNRGVLSIDFGSNTTAQPDVATCPDCYTVEVRMTDYTVPAQETTYACESFEFPRAAEGDAHAIAFYPRIDNAEVVHHILVHSCPNDGTWRATLGKPGICLGKTPIGVSPFGVACQTLLFSWAVGAGPVVLPQEAGVRIGPNSNRYIMVEVHYNNRKLRVGAKDSTALAFVMTKTLRKHDAGMLMIGDPMTAQDDLPAGLPLVHRQGLCTSGCTGQAIPQGQSVTIYANFMHMHAFGRQQFSNIYSKDGAFKTTLGTVNFWNLYVPRTSACCPRGACPPTGSVGAPDGALAH